MGLACCPKTEKRAHLPHVEVIVLDRRRRNPRPIRFTGPGGPIKVDRKATTFADILASPVFLCLLQQGAGILSAGKKGNNVPRGKTARAAVTDPLRMGSSRGVFTTARQDGSGWGRAGRPGIQLQLAEGPARVLWPRDFGGPRSDSRRPKSRPAPRVSAISGSHAPHQASRARPGPYRWVLGSWPRGRQPWPAVFGFQGRLGSFCPAWRVSKVHQGTA